MPLKISRLPSRCPGSASRSSARFSPAPGSADLAGWRVRRRSPRRAGPISGSPSPIRPGLRGAAGRLDGVLLTATAGALPCVGPQSAGPPVGDLLLQALALGSRPPCGSYRWECSHLGPSGRPVLSGALAMSLLATTLTTFASPYAHFFMVMLLKSAYRSCVIQY